MQPHSISPIRRLSTLRTPAMLAGLVASFATLQGCIATPTSSLERMNNAVVYGQMAIDDPQIVVATDGPVDIDIESFGGTVLVEAVPGLKNTIIEPVRHANHGHLRRDEAESSLDEMDYVVELIPGDLNRETVRVVATSADLEEHFQGVDFRIRTADLGSVRVRTDHGRVWVKNNTGGVDVETTHGDIRVITDHAMNDPIILVTKEGDVDYRAPKGSTGIYDLRSIGGLVYNRFTEARVVSTSPDNDPATFIADVGGGLNPVLVRTTYGDIRVAVTEFPTGVGPIIME
ncbi:MAG: DUF4097 family beta strand repeat-containing protein [Phycisphaerales bacterium]|nr:DUF4097 family beta strand repeat-containing protein [Phycisphaerales bacterium]MDG1977075.1 DUF4097 family beta strand repeat-containing protein [Phycisphaerales bacterium]MDG2132436.1 DUF4097 family beta strand repeat-containing protein [Phycisphaerales bacterium]